MVLGGCSDKVVCDAAKRGDIALLRNIFSQGAGSSNALNVHENGWTALMFAASSGHLGIVTYLIEEGADVNVTSTFGHTALHVAAARGQYECVKFLLKFSTSIDLEAINGSALALAVLKGHRKVAQLLLDAGSDARSSKTLRYAIISNDIHILNWLLNKLPGNSIRNVVNGRDSVSNQAPIHIAVLLGHPDAISLLLRYGADCNVADPSGRTPLCMAVASNDVETIKCLLSNGDCEINRSDMTSQHLSSLHVAAHKGHMMCLRTLVASKADLNVRDAMSVTPLMHAINMSRLTSAACLIAEGCNLDLAGQLVSNASIVYSTTPIELALRKGHDLLAFMLISANCKTNHLSHALIHSRPWLCAKLQAPHTLLDLSRNYIRCHLGQGISSALAKLMLPPGLRALLLLRDLSINIQDGESPNEDIMPYTTSGVRTNFDQHIYASVI